MSEMRFNPSYNMRASRAERNTQSWRNSSRGFEIMAIEQLQCEVCCDYRGVRLIPLCPEHIDRSLHFEQRILHAKADALKEMRETEEETKRQLAMRSSWE